MTTIAIKDGVIAADSSIGAQGVRYGEARKLWPVHQTRGGGWAAGSGNFSEVADAEEIMLGHFDGREPNVTSETTIVHLRADGGVRWLETGGGWFSFKADFYATGSGEKFALGAMAAGATAAQAVEIAARYDTRTHSPFVTGSIKE